MRNTAWHLLVPPISRLPSLSTCFFAHKPESIVRIVLGTPHLPSCQQHRPSRQSAAMTCSAAWRQRQQCCTAVPQNIDRWTSSCIQLGHAACSQKCTQRVIHLDHEPLCKTNKVSTGHSVHVLTRCNLHMSQGPPQLSEEHVQGKQYQGWLAIRDKFKVRRDTLLCDVKKRRFHSCCRCLSCMWLCKCFLINSHGHTSCVHTVCLIHVKAAAAYLCFRAGAA